MSDSIFSTLSAVSIAGKTERKGNLDYLSWATAWSLLKKHYPDAQRVVYEDPHSGLNFFTDGRTAYVKVGIIVGGIEHIDYLPIMDYRNAAIPVEKITSFEVNKTIQRSTAKAIALHGLGLSLWIGEDVTEAAPVVAAAPAAKIALKVDDDNWSKVVSYATGNKGIGLDSIVKNLEVKYMVSAAVKTAIAKIIEE
jgi:hypothetical protein